MKNIKDSFKVLIVDDSPANIEVLYDILSDYTCYVALYGEIALHLAQSKIQPDLILLDVMMPEMDGFEVCKRLKANEATKEIPVIFITSKTDQESIVKGFEYGAVDYITKPFNKNELLSRVSTHLELKLSKDKIKKHKNELETLVDKRTKELLVAKNRAEECDKLKTAFLENMSHEVRTPLNVISGFSELLLESDIAEKDKKEFRKLIVQNTNILLNHIDSIMDMAKIISNQFKIQKEKCNIDAILDELNKTFTKKKLDFNKENIDLIISKPNLSDDLIILTDPVRLKQVFFNLIDNALKFTDKGYIKLGYVLNDQKDQNIKFFVEDTGIGLHQKQHNYIFEFFNKIKNKNKLYGGLGLGLAISKEIIQLLGGEIWVESSPDKGSTFNFTILSKYVCPNPKIEDKTFLIKRTQPSMINR